MATVLSRPGDTLDLLLWRETGTSAQLVAALEANPGLAAAGEVLPDRTPVALPETEEAPPDPVIRLWGQA